MTRRIRGSNQYRTRLGADPPPTASSDLLAQARLAAASTGDDDSSSDKMRPAKSVLQLGVAAFLAAGGSVSVVSNPDKEMKMVQQLLEERMARDGGRISHRAQAGFKMTRDALAEGVDDHGLTLVARIDDEWTAGAIHASPVLFDQIESLHISFVGSTGIAPGAGSVLVKEVIDTAATLGMPITFEPLPDSGGFWIDKLGTHIDPTGEGAPSYGWTAAEVQQMARGN